MSKVDKRTTIENWQAFLCAIYEDTAAGKFEPKDFKEYCTTFRVGTVRRDIVLDFLHSISRKPTTQDVMALRDIINARYRAMAKARKENVQTTEKVNELNKLDDHELIEELRKRGYTGKLIKMEPKEFTL